MNDTPNPPLVRNPPQIRRTFCLDENLLVVRIVMETGGKDVERCGKRTELKSEGPQPQFFAGPFGYFKFQDILGCM